MLFLYRNLIRFVGKSSITVQFVDNHFVDTYNPTIENTFHKFLKFRGLEYDIRIVDTAGTVLFILFFISCVFRGNLYCDARMNKNYFKIPMQWGYTAMHLYSLLLLKLHLRL